MTSMTMQKAPPLSLTLAEGRSLFELASFYLLRMPMKRFPKGDGHPVIFYPGFGASDISTRPMRRLFDQLGYRTYGWEMGRNVQFNPEREMEMRAFLKKVFDLEGRKVTLVGWSLGGLFARGLAKSFPEYVRGVITLGSPISGNADHSRASGIYRSINGVPSGSRQRRMNTMNDAPPVPTTSIYSKTDGVVAWQGSIQKPMKQTENIRVPGSHLGLGVNPMVMHAIADRLSLPEGKWVPYRQHSF